MTSTTQIVAPTLSPSVRPNIHQNDANKEEQMALLTLEPQRNPDHRKMTALFAEVLAMQLITLSLFQ